jgi:hypothetical protein
MELFVNAFDILYKMTLLDGNSKDTSPDTIKTYERDGSFINLNTTEGIDAFIVPFPHRVHVDTLPPSEEEPLTVYTLPPPEKDTITAAPKRQRTDGGRKNKHHKTNKRKKCKSKRNRRNKNKNTRKKR